MWEVRPEYGKKSPRGPSHSFGNLKIAICLVGYANDRLIDQRFPKQAFVVLWRLKIHKIDHNPTFFKID
ncbi:hypothetical protein, partial [Staphylococcus arlettae]|uniref:hypothetical protein n=1 Tax=Staphylococcus arlettae TaxID=29378 RepID=UPI003CECA51F